MKQALVAALLSLPLFAQAQVAPPAAPASSAKPVTGYECQVIIATDVAADQDEWKFDVRVQGESHGGNGRSFAAGANAVDATADGHWLTLSWSKAGKLVAQGVFCMAPTDFAENRVAILYNPDGSGEQVSIGCSAKH